MSDKRKIRETPYQRRLYELFRDGESLGDIAEKTGMSLGELQELSETFEWNRRRLQPLESAKALQASLDSYLRLSMAIQGNLQKRMLADITCLNDPKARPKGWKPMRLPRGIGITYTLNPNVITQAALAVQGINQWLALPPQVALHEKTETELTKTNREDEDAYIDEIVSSLERIERQGKAEKAQKKGDAKPAKDVKKKKKPKEAKK